MLNKVLLVALVVLLSVTATAANYYYPMFPQAVAFGENSAASVVKVSLAAGGHGTGVYIGNGRILTAAHVAKVGVEGGFVIKNYLGAENHATVLWFNEVADVGLLRLDAPFTDKNGGVNVLKAVPIACAQPDASIGARIEVIGHPVNLENIHTWGHVASSVDMRGVPSPQVNVLADITIAPGSSGGPAFDIDGNLVGITVALALAPITSLLGVTPSLVALTYIIPKSVICQELAAKHDAPVVDEKETP